MTNDTTDTIGTATQVASVLGLDQPVGHTETTIILSNAQARRLLALATKAKDAWACVPEEDAVEMLGALSVASQMYATCGDKVMSGHFQGLYGKYAHRQES